MVNIIYKPTGVVIEITQVAWDILSAMEFFLTIFELAPAPVEP